VKAVETFKRVWRCTLQEKAMSNRNAPSQSNEARMAPASCRPGSLSRRSFLGAAAAGAAGLAVSKPTRSAAKGSILRIPEPVTASTGSRLNIGACKSVKMTCISEVGWHSNDKLNADVAAGGGFDANQWEVPWDNANAGGSVTRS
jgi:hypothetical protein